MERWMDRQMTKQYYKMSDRIQMLRIRELTVTFFQHCNIIKH